MALPNFLNGVLKVKQGKIILDGEVDLVEAVKEAFDKLLPNKAPEEVLETILQEFVSKIEGEWFLNRTDTPPPPKE